MNHLEILRHYGIRAQKSLGQNFLVNDDILETITDSIDITGKDILEIGPGYGALTEKILARKPKSLTLIELDKKMIHILHSRIIEKDLIIPSETDFQIIEWDVLKYIPGIEKKQVRTKILSKEIQQENSQKRWNSWEICVPKRDVLLSTLSKERKDWAWSSLFWEFSCYSIIANIPYYITSPILFRFLHELENKPDEMVILMQKEVGDKICKKKWYNNSYLSLALEFSCETIQEVCLVGKTNFIPAPKIDSSVLYFKRKVEYCEQKAKKFLSMTSAGFSAPRKKLISNLANVLRITKEDLQEIFEKLQFLETARAEELNIEQWKQLIENIEKNN